MNEKITTLFGGKKCSVQFADGRTEEITVRQLPLGEYERAFQFLDDELAITALICGKDKNWLTGTPPDASDSILPEHYEMLQADAREVNAKGFFAWSARRQAREAAALNEKIAAMAKLSPEQLKAATESGARLMSPTSSPTSPRPRG